jgi:hypothetical protein
VVVKGPGDRGEISSDRLGDHEPFPETRTRQETFIEQFAYRYSISDAGDMGAYAVKFSQSFAMIGLCAFNGSVIREVGPDDHKILTPFQHAA